MFDLGWPELGVIAVLAVLILGPKELPTAMRTVAKWVKRIRGMAREFQGHLDEVVREAELQDVRDGLKKAQRMDLGRELEKEIDPTGEFRKDLDDTKNLDLNSVPRQAKDAADEWPSVDPARPVAEVNESAATADDAVEQTEPKTASQAPKASDGEKGV